MHMENFTIVFQSTKLNSIKLMIQHHLTNLISTEFLVTQINRDRLIINAYIETAECLLPGYGYVTFYRLVFFTHRHLQILHPPLHWVHAELARKPDGL